MRIGLATSNYGSLAAKPRLLIAGFSLGKRLNASHAEPPGTSVESEQAAIAQIEKLLGNIRDQALEAVARGGHGAQHSIDRALAEIGELLGTPLALGGSDHALLTGLNNEQIIGYEIRKLRPNASVTFTGSLDRGQSDARLVIPELTSLRLSGGSLELNTSNGHGTIQVAAGDSVHRIVSRINNSGRFGNLRAGVVGDALELISTSQGHRALLNVVSRSKQSSESYGPLQVSGINASQVAALDTSGLTPGIPVALSGSRDALVSAAELVYQGAAGALAAGSATFRLQGDLGSADLSVTAGESLADFAQRINDASPTTGVQAEVVGDTLTFRSLAKGANAGVTIDNIVRDSQVSVSGANAAQVADLNVLSIPDETEITLTGTVTQAADSARQTYHGAAGGTVVDSASFTLTGSLGSVPFAITQGESLADVAQRINQDTAATGVAAETIGNDLHFYSIEVGSSESLQVQLESVTQYVDVSGVNGSQVTSFQVLSAEADSVNTLTGNVTQAATQGQLTYLGASNRTLVAADFLLTGALGSASLSVDAFEKLTSVRDKINAQTSNTGIVATASGNTLTLTSQGYGSTAGIVQVDVNSGTFNTSGGDGNGHAAGLDALLNINGNTLSGDGNQVSYANALGNYAFTLAAGFTGSISPITITSANGTFAVSGGDAFGIAYGIDAAATINGQSLTAAGNDFSATIDDVNFALSLVPGFVGALDPITIASMLADFTITGGDGNGSATGSDGSATINGEIIFSDNDAYEVTTSGGPLTITFTDTFVGDFDEIDITFETTEPTVHRSTSYSAVGSQTNATINGQQADEDEGFYVIEQDGVEIALRFADGFRGEFDSFTVSAGGSDSSSPGTTSLNGSLLAAVQAALGDINSLASGGTNSGLGNNAGRALVLAVDALANLRSLKSSAGVSGRRTLSGNLFDRVI